MAATLTIGKKVHNVMNRWAIPPHLEDAYCSGNVIIQEGEDIIELFEEGTCRGCGRYHKDIIQPKYAEKPILLCCTNKEVNRYFGYVVPVCIDCFYYMEYRRDRKIPKSIKKRIEAGFVPYKIYDLI